MTARDRIQQVAEQWFLTEPVFFAVYCSHRLAMNANMQCPLRTGKGRVEYNPTVIDVLQDNQLNELLKVEMIRILLQHPYARQPLGCKPKMLQAASDMVISPAYKFSWIDLAKPEDYGLPVGQHYEWYANRLNDMAVHHDGDAPGEGDSGGLQGEGSSQEAQGEQDQEQGQGQEKDECQELSSSSEEKDSEGKGNGQGEGNGKGEGQGEGNGQGEGKGQGEGDGQGGCFGQKGGNGQGQGANGSGKGQGNASGGAGMGEGMGEPGSGGSDSDSKTLGEADYTALWEEDQFQSLLITDLIQSTTSWGSMPSGMIELIKKAAEGKIDFRSALRGFRATIISQKRRLTRMRPSRRFGFEQMGSRYDFITHLLVAIDTSGSVGSEELGRYFRVITSFFKYGVQEIDVLMFDFIVKGEPVTLKEAQKHRKEFKVEGRGGTNFQAPIDYVREHPDYDGLIIITDGWAPTPEVPSHLKAKLLWIIDNEPSYKQNYESLRKTGRVCLMQL